MTRDQTGRALRDARREERTIGVMVSLYCRDHHADRPRVTDQPDEGPGRHRQLCEECAALLTYARRRLVACRYGSDKPTCARCPTHCYKPAMREQVRQVMRYSGPRMVRRHPVLALAHLLDGRREAPRTSPPPGRGEPSSRGEDIRP